MNYIDYIILAILAYGLIKGFINGLIIEVASVVALILGIWGAIRFSGFVGQRLTEYFDLTTKWLGLLSFVITFILIVLAIHLLAKILDKLLKAVALGIPVKILGALFGVIKTALILSIMFVILNTINSNRNLLPSEKMGESILYSTVSDLAPMLFPIIEGGDLLKSWDKYKRKPEEPVI